MVTDSRLSCLNLSTQQLKQIADDFCRQMEQGLAGQVTSLSMLSSFLSPALGHEQGFFLALDFGGTNVRILEVELMGSRKLRVKRKKVFPLQTVERSYTANECTGAMLFDYIASEIADFVGQRDARFLLGHTFSFPFAQNQPNQALLLRWTKEFQTREVIGQDVTQLLIAALRRQGLDGITPVAVVNDTVATLLAASYHQPAVTIGSICGTGHNSCYVENNSESAVIINLESGNFSGIPITEWDARLDSDSERPGAQLFEKQVSGGYLGKLTSLIFAEFIPVRSGSCDLTGEDLSGILAASSPAVIAQIFMKSGLTLAEPDCQFLRDVTAAVTKRSARLVAASFSGILVHVDPKLQRTHKIAIDGSLFEKLPGYAEQLWQALIELRSRQAERIQLVPVKDGSGIGAAVGAALSLD